MRGNMAFKVSQDLVAPSLRSGHYRAGLLDFNCGKTTCNLSPNLYLEKHYNQPRIKNVILVQLGMT